MPRRTKGRHLGHRDALRARLALDLVDGAALTAQQVTGRYYANVSASSFHKTFKRDRDALEAEGIYLVEEPVGTAKIWRLDRRRTIADLSATTDNEARVTATLLRPLIDDPTTANPSALGCAIARMGRDIADAGVGKTDPGCNQQTLATVAQALQERRPCELAYTARDEAEPVFRLMLVYGLFELGGCTYVVGLRKRNGKDDAIRTLNLARASAAVIRDELERYDIPADFDIADYRLLPFEIGPEEPAEATLYVSRSCAAAFREQARRRGTQRPKQGGSIEWRGTVRNTPACAAWCTEVGAIPLKPQTLVDAWEQLLEGVLDGDS